MGSVQGVDPLSPLVSFKNVRNLTRSPSPQQSAPHVSLDKMDHMQFPNTFTDEGDETVMTGSPPSEFRGKVIRSKPMAV